MAVKTHKPDYTLILIIAVILVFGLVMLSSASSFLGFEKFNDSNYYLKHQLLYGLSIGLVAFFLLSKIDYHVWKKYALFFMILNVFLLLAIFIPGLGFGYGGARRWIQVGFFTIQPSEILKLVFVLYLSTLFAKNIEHIKDPNYSLMPFLVILGTSAILIMMQPDMGTLITIILIALSIYFVAGASWKHLLWFILGSGGLFLLLIKIAPYRTARLTVFLNPAIDPQGIGYHINQALLAIGSGGFFGLGLGHSRQKLLYLPEVTGDSIFAIIAEEVGFLFALVLIALFLTLMYKGFQIAKRAPDAFGRLVATGITAWFVLQAFINIAAMVTLVPLTGIPLPFVSYGSSALAISLAAVGILVNISKQTNQ
jgi:cell division protein FtsW